MADLTARRQGPLLVWGVAVSVHIISVFHRSSLGVAGLVAGDRFHVTATELSSLAVMQLVVYAFMQVPVGVLVDRFGARRLLLVGLGLMTAAQFVFAFATTYEVALGARLVLGIGDGLIFVSVLQVIQAWLPAQRAGLFGQMSAGLGLVGSLAATVPLTLALQQLGWTGTFGAASGLGLVLLVLVALLVQDSPSGHVIYAGTGLRDLLRSVPELLAHPGARLAALTHFNTQFPLVVLTVLWGFPFLVRGEGLSDLDAGALLMLLTPGWLVSAAVVTRAVTRWPYWRSYIAMGVAGLAAVAWLAVLLWPGRAPISLLALLVLAVSACGPATLVGYDVARSLTPTSMQGRVSGLVNVGGFLGALIALLLIGLFLDWRAPGGPSTYTLPIFKQAMATQFALWALGFAGVVYYRIAAIRRLHGEHPHAVERLRGGHAFVFPG